MKKTIKEKMIKSLVQIGELEAMYGAESTCAFFFFQPEEPEALKKKYRSER